MTSTTPAVKKTATKAAAKKAAPEQAALPATIEQVIRTGLQQYATPVMDLNARYIGVVYDVTDRDQMVAAKAARVEIRDLRYKIQKHKDAVVSELSDASKMIKAEAESMIEPLLQVENPIHDMINAEEKRVEQIKQEAREKEAARIKEMEDAIAQIGTLRAQAAGADADTIQGISATLAGMDFADFDEVYLLAAEEERNAALTAVQRALSDRKELDQQQHLQAQRDAEQRQRQAELDQQQEAQRATNEARARLSSLQSDTLGAAATHSADPEWFDRALERLAAIDHAAAFAPLTAEEVKPSIDTVHTLLTNLRGVAVTGAENARLLQQAKEQEEARRAEDLRQREEAAAAERKAEEDRRVAAEAEAIRVATLETAAGEALQLLIALGQKSHLTTRKLDAALARLS